MRFPGWVSPVPRGGYTPPAPRPPLRWSIPHPPSPSRPRILIFRAFSYYYKMQRVSNPLSYVAISTLYSYRVKSASISALRALPAPLPAPCPRGRAARSPALKPPPPNLPIHPPGSQWAQRAVVLVCIPSRVASWCSYAPITAPQNGQPDLFLERQSYHIMKPWSDGTKKAPHTAAHERKYVK